MYKQTKVFVIREVSSGKLIQFGSNKCGWTSTTAAKNALNLHMRHKYNINYDSTVAGLFDKQSEFVIEEII